MSHFLSNRNIAQACHRMHQLMNAGWPLEGKPGCRPATVVVWCHHQHVSRESRLWASLFVTGVNTGLSLQRSNQGKKKPINIKMLTLNLLCSTGNMIQYSVMACVGKESKKSGECVYIYVYISGPPRWCSGKESTCQAGDVGLIPGSERPPGEGHGNSFQYSSGESHGQRSLVQQYFNRNFF